MKLLVKILIVLVFVLIILGSVLVFSASGTYSATKFNDVYVLFKAHIIKVITAIGALIVFATVPYENYKKYNTEPQHIETELFLNTDPSYNYSRQEICRTDNSLIG